MTLYCSPRGRSGKGRGPEGSGLYPELAAYRISEGCSPNVQAEVGRLVGQLPIAAARAELARRGLAQDEKTVRRIASELGAQMLATRTRDLLRFRAGELPAGTGAVASMPRIMRFFGAFASQNVPESAFPEAASIANTTDAPPTRPRSSGSPEGPRSAGPPPRSRPSPNASGVARTPSCTPPPSPHCRSANGSGDSARSPGA